MKKIFSLLVLSFSLFVSTSAQDIAPQPLKAKPAHVQGESLDTLSSLPFTGSVGEGIEDIPWGQRVRRSLDLLAQEANRAPYTAGI